MIDCVDQKDMMCVFENAWKCGWHVAAIPKEFLTNADKELGEFVGLVRAINILGWCNRFKIYCRLETRKLQESKRDAEAKLMLDFLRGHFDDTFYI